MNNRLLYLRRWKRAYLLIFVLGSSLVGDPVATASAQEVLVGAGDIADCNRTQDEATARPLAHHLAKQQPGCGGQIGAGTVATRRSGRYVGSLRAGLLAPRPVQFRQPPRQRSPHTGAVSGPL